ncbi:MAG TPA: redox-regulated ATPase YchF [Dehalococcoidales bacterium]|nr:redox-regulated ATPase YchF [Dehalococcoidales bacterium]
MSLTCGLVGLTACGKTTIYNAVTASGAAHYDGSKMHRVIVNVPDPRIQALAKLYNPAKIVPATMQLVDIPGLATNSANKPGHSTRLLKHIKDVDTLLHVIRCFEAADTFPRHDNIDPVRDVETIDLELMVADSQTLQKKIARLSKKVRAGDSDAIRQVADCEKIKRGLDQGIPARRQRLDDKELNSIRECNLVSLKPVLYIANVKSMGNDGNDYVKALQTIIDADSSEAITICGRDEADISQLDPVDRQEFLAELGLQESSMMRLLQAAYRKLGLVNFFTVGEDEVRAWTCHRGDKAPVAAGKIHTDMERGFIRMEVIPCNDLLELGSEAAVIKAGKQRIEGKTYEIQEGDVTVVLFNIS